MKRYFLSVLILLVLVLGVAYLATNVKVAGLSGLQVAQTSPPNDGCEDTLQTVAAANNINPNDVIMITGVQVGLPVNTSFTFNNDSINYTDLEVSMFVMSGGMEQDFDSDPNQSSPHYSAVESLSQPPNQTVEQFEVSTDQQFIDGTLYSWRARGAVGNVWSGYSGAKYFFVCS